MKIIARAVVTCVVGAVGLVGWTAAVVAEDTPKPCPICRHANKPSAPYAETTSSTLLRGALNTAFGWTELLVEPAAEVQRQGDLVTGLGKGVSLAVKRTVLGLGELVTFWVPRSKASEAPLATDCPICRTAFTQPPPSASPTPESSASKKP